MTSLSSSPARAAALVDTELGVQESVEFFGPGPELLAGATYLPVVGPRVGGLVICPSICNDFLRSYRREVVLARQLAGHGVAVQRFHYRGIGNSDGDELAMTFPAMREDVDTALDRLGAADSGPVAFLGTRFGALLAASAAAASPGAPLVLVDPVIAADKFFWEAWRAPMARALREGETPLTREVILGQLEARGWVDVLGHTVGRPLYTTSSGRTLVDELGDGSRPILLVQLGGAGGLRPANDRLVGELAGRGFTVDVEIAGDEQSWWFFDEDEAPPTELVPAVAAWVAARLAEVDPPASPARPAPAPVPDAGAGPGTGDATAAQELPVFFPAAGDDLFGILTRPGGEARGVCAVLLSGGVWTPSPGRNRIWVRLARELAGDGFHALRLDYRGVGESTGVTLGYQLDAPFVDDALGGCEWVRSQGVSATVLLGSCFGARTALAAAGHLADVRGVALFPVPVRDFVMGERLSSLPPSVLLRKAASGRGLAGLFRADKRRSYRRIISQKWRRARAGRRDEPGEGFRWVSKALLGQLTDLVEREVPVLLVFGEQDTFYEDFQRGQDGPLGELLDRAGDLVQVRLVAGKTHGLATTAVQDEVVGVLRAWLPAVTRPPG